MWLNVIYLNKKTNKNREFNIIIHGVKTTDIDELTIKESCFISHVIEFYRTLNETAKDFNLTEKKGYNNI